MASADPDRPEMTPEEFRLLRELVYAHSGILVRDDLKFVMERRLWPRLEALGLAGYAAYYQYLRYDEGRAAELEASVEALATHETYFFREPLQLEAFAGELLPLLHVRNGRQKRLRLWSAGCSSGEEAYTLAMLVQDARLFDGWDVEVLGTDLSRRVLAAARRAEYGPSALRAAPPEALSRHFDPAGPGRFRVKDGVRAAVAFGHLNLLDPNQGQLVPRMDAIFCRNVMIYFDLAARKRALKLFHDTLVDGGYLLLGHSESLINVTADFELVHLKTDLVYRRPTRRGGEP